MNARDLQRLFEAVRMGRLDSHEAVAQVLHESDAPTLRPGEPVLLQAALLPSSELVARVRDAAELGANILIESLDLEGADALATFPGFEYYPLGAIGRILQQPLPERNEHVLVVAPSRTEASLLETIEVTLDTFGIPVVKETSIHSLTLGQYRRLVAQADSASAVVWVASVKTAWIHPLADEIRKPMVVVPSVNLSHPDGIDPSAWYQALVASQPHGVLFVGPNQGVAAAIGVSRVLPAADSESASQTRTGTDD